MTDKLRAAAQAALELLTGPLWGDGAYMDSDVYPDAREVAKQLRAALAALAEPDDTDDVAKKLAVAEQSRDWYKRRTEALQQFQTRMRDPERTMVCDILANGRPLEPPGNRYATLTPEVEQDPYCYIYEYDGVFGLHREFYPRPYNGMKPTRTVPVYTTPPRREWVGLTVKERASIYDKYRRGEMVDSFEMMFAVEDKLKERNT